MRHALFLAARALAASPGQTALVSLALALTFFLPLFTGGAARLAERRLMERAESTPAVVGAPGSPLDLTLSALWFRGEVVDPVPSSARSLAAPYGVVVPLHVRHRAGGLPVVGAGPEYLEQRGLAVAQGRRYGLIGEAVLGAAAAGAARLGPGDVLRVDQPTLHDLSAAAPLQLEIVGVLSPSGGPDDGAVFVDLNTTWALDGSLHGHAEISEAEALNPDAQADEALQASAGVFLAAELSAEQRASFHGHSDPEALPVDALLVFTTDRQSLDKLLGDDALAPELSVVRPARVVDEVFEVVLRARELLSAVFAALGVCTLLLVINLTRLSLRLRREELALMARLGCDPGVLPTMIAAELGAQLLAGLLLAGLSAAAALSLLDHLLRS